MAETPHHVWESRHHHACPSFDPHSLGMKTPQHHTTPTPKGCLTHSPPHHLHQIPSACCLPGRSLARLTHVSFLTPPMLEPAERRRSQPPPARSLTSSRRSLGRASEAGGRVFLLGTAAASTNGGHQRALRGVPRALIGQARRAGYFCGCAVAATAGLSRCCAGAARRHHRALSLL